MSIEEILDRLDDPDPGVRATAEEALRQLGPSAAVPLLTLACDDALPSDSGDPEGAGFGVWLAGIALITFQIPAIADHLHGGTAAIAWILLCLIEFPALFLIARRAAAYSAAEYRTKAALRLARATKAARVLEKMDDPRILGPLIAECGLQRNPDGSGLDRGIPAVIDRAMCRLLPKLTGDNIGLLAVSRDHLYSLLSSFYALSRPDALLALLDLAVRLEDTKALGPVRELARGAVASPNSHRVREAARACLPRLEAAYERQRPGEVLLRASSAPGAPSEVLLRPVQGAGDTAVRLLLRPTGEDGGETGCQV